MSFKRHRSSSPTPSTSSSISPEPTPKASRTAPLPTSPTSRVLCTLPPTCHRHPTPLTGTKDLEAHYAKYHAHVCEQPGCSCVFPDARLLELHQTECHDPLAAVRKDRGEKIFACHLSTCRRLFSTPKSRRLHLIEAHAYPKEYFFAVTNKGVGGLLKKWGEGASLIRGEWKAREQQDGADDEEGEEDVMGSDNPTDEEGMEVTAQIPTSNGSTSTSKPASKPSTSRSRRKQRVPSSKGMDHPKDESSLNALTDQMTSLSLVPPSIRFGRGGKNGGFINNTGPGFGHEVHSEVQRGRGGGTSTRGSAGADVRGGMRGRGRGRGNVDVREREGGVIQMDMDVGRGRATGRGRVIPRGRARGRGGRGITRINVENVG